MVSDPLGVSSANDCEIGVYHELQGFADRNPPARKQRDVSGDASSALALFVCFDCILRIGTVARSSRDSSLLLLL